MSSKAEAVPEIVLSFREALEDLQRNDHYEIENLTMIAKEAIEHAQAISQEVEAHIRKTRPEFKLPALYLLDSLVKHIGTPYTVFLGRSLYNTFFNAYTMVDTNTRRAIDELFRSWTKPVPESRDPRPVFAPEVTQAIDTALSRMRGVNTWSLPNLINDQGSSRDPVTPAARSTPHSPALGRHVAHQPYHQMLAHGTLDSQSYALQNGASSSQPNFISSEFQSHSPSVRPSSTASLEPPRNFQPVVEDSIEYVYTGPPPATMSHQARLEKLRYDVLGLLHAVRTLLEQQPFDQDRLKLQQNLHSLKHLLDTGALSLAHIQSTEIVVANVARDLPVTTHNSQPAATMPAPQLPRSPAFDASTIAGILARGKPQRVQTSPHKISLPSLTMPQSEILPIQPPMPSEPILEAKPPSRSPQPATVTQMASSVAYQKSFQAASNAANSSLLDQLRASGLLGKALSHTVSLRQGADASTQSLLSVRQAPNHAAGTSKWHDDSLRTSSMALMRRLYEEMPDQCRQCGVRFVGMESGKTQKGLHLDWHFKVNTRVQDSSRFAIHRSWYVDESDWTYYQETPGIDASQRSELGQMMKLNPSVKDVKDDFVFVPTDARLVNLPCSICQEKFEQGWNEETQQPTWRDAVRLGNRYYHASCYAEVARGSAAGSMGTKQRTSNTSARGTPDSVLGKRRFEDFGLDVPTR